MSCECVNYACLKVLYNPCSEGAELNVTADETGTWSALIEFNGTWLSQDFEVVNGEKVVINNVFNPSYNHLLKLYNATGDLVNETCYKVEVTATANSTYTPTVSNTSLETYRLDFTVDGNPMAFTQLIGAVLLSVYVEGLDIPSTLDDETGELTFNGSVGDDQTGYILYKK